MIECEHFATYLARLMPDKARYGSVPGPGGCVCGGVCSLGTGIRHLSQMHVVKCSRQRDKKYFICHPRMYLVPEEINIAELLIILLSDAFADLVSISSFEGYKRNCAVNNLAGLSLNHCNPPDPSF